MNNSKEVYILANVTYELRWSDHGDFQDDGSGGYCSGGEGEEMEPQIVKQEKIIRVWEFHETKNYEFNERNLECLSYKINMCASDHASRYCTGCYQEYRAIKAEYIRTIEIKRTISTGANKRKLLGNGW